MRILFNEKLIIRSMFCKIKLLLLFILNLNKREKYGGGVCVGDVCIVKYMLARI